MFFSCVYSQIQLMQQNFGLSMKTRRVRAGSAFPLNFGVRALNIWIRGCAFMSSVCQVKVFSNQQKMHCVLSPLDLHVMFFQRQTSNTEKL